MAIKFETNEQVTAFVTAGNKEYGKQREAAFNALIDWTMSFGLQLMHNTSLAPSIRPTVKNTREILRVLWGAANKDNAVPVETKIGRKVHVCEQDRFRYDLASRVFKLFSAAQSRPIAEDFNAAIASGDAGKLKALVLDLATANTMVAVDTWIKGDKPATKSEKTTGQKLESALSKNMADTSANEQATLAATLMAGIAQGTDKAEVGQLLAGAAVAALSKAGKVGQGATVARQVIQSIGANADPETAVEMLKALQGLVAAELASAEQRLAEKQEQDAEKARAEQSKADLAAQADAKDAAKAEQAELDELSEAA